jgi:hypothetical protein
MQLKHAVVALAAAGVLSTQAYASEAQAEAVLQPAQPVAAFTEADIQALFEDTGKPMQLAALSAQEMRETEGALAPWAVGGLVGGAWQGANYAWGAYRGNYAWNTSRFLGNVGTGALIGASFGTAGHIASGGARFIPSLTNAGANVWRFNAVIANRGVNHVWRR